MGTLDRLIPAVMASITPTKSPKSEIIPEDARRSSAQISKLFESGTFVGHSHQHQLPEDLKGSHMASRGF